MRPIVVAHRGFSGKFPENTLRAVEEALKLPIDCIELDVRRTKDGTLVVIHDETVDRTTNGSGRVRELTWNEIRKLDAGSWKGEEFAGECIPRVDEALQLVNGKVVVFLEIKEPDTTPQLIDLVRKLNASSWVQIGSFHKEAISMAKELAPEISCTLIGGADVGATDDAFANFIKEALSCGASSVSINYPALTQERIRQCHKRWLFVGAWTVNEFELVRQLTAIGVDAIASDFPDVVLEALQQCS
jgi:glycerophosphoryl diester phosphodiesterase